MHKLTDNGDNILKSRYGEWFQFGSFIKRPTISIGFIKWNVFYLAVVCQFFPGFVQASAFNEPQFFGVSHNSCLVPQKGGSIEGMSAVAISLRDGCKFWLKSGGDRGPSGLDTLSMLFVMNEPDLECKRKYGNEYGSNSGKGEVVFYQSEEFHAFLAGGFLGLVGWVIFFLGQFGLHILREPLWRCQEAWRVRK